VSEVWIAYRCLSLVSPLWSMIQAQHSARTNRYIYIEVPLVSYHDLDWLSPWHCMVGVDQASTVHYCTGTVHAMP